MRKRGSFPPGSEEGRMTMRNSFRYCVPFILLWFSSFFLNQNLQAQILLNEFMADPARDWDGDGEYSSRDDEWIEVINAGDSEVDLSGYMISDGAEGYSWRYAFSGILSPGEVFVVYGSDSRAWEEANDFPVYGLSLNNAGDRISIFRVAGNDTVLVDHIDFVDNAAEDDRSVGRVAGDPETWRQFDAFTPCPGSCNPPGNGCVPTPGFINDCITSTEDVSWGLIKTRYAD